MKDQFSASIARPRSSTCEIQSLEAELVAIEQYYRVSRAEQKIRPEDIEPPVRDMRKAIEDCAHRTTRCAKQSSMRGRDATTAGSIGQSERATAKKLSELLRQELRDLSPGDAPASVAPIARRSTG